MDDACIHRFSASSEGHFTMNWNANGMLTFNKHASTTYNNVAISLGLISTVQCHWLSLQVHVDE